MRRKTVWLALFWAVVITAMTLLVLTFVHGVPTQAELIRKGGETMLFAFVIVLFALRQEDKS